MWLHLPVAGDAPPPWLLPVAVDVNNSTHLVSPLLAGAYVWLAFSRTSEVRSARASSA